MLNILIDAYAISPNWGSEQGMGWNWISNLAKTCNLYIITEGEWRNEIECSISAAMRGDMDETMNPTGLTRQQASHMHFYYLPVTQKVREMCWQQGTWKFYFHYRKWEYRAYEKAKEIITTFANVPGAQVDVLHKLNMIGFREPGYLWKVRELPFVWGPVGGYGSFPIAYLKGARTKTKIKSIVKNILNYVSFFTLPRVRKAAQRSDLIVAAYRETFEAFRTFYRSDVIQINETGCFINLDVQPHSSNSSMFHLLWVGKFDYIKQLGIAIHTMKYLRNNQNIHLFVVGTGNPKDVDYYTEMVKQCDVQDNVHMLGVLPNIKTRELMKQMDLFFFTSVSDATSTVVPEAISAGLPVLCHNMRGYGDIVDEKIGRKIKPINPNHSALEFARIIKELESNRQAVRQMSANCLILRNEISWESNSKRMVKLYESAIDKR